MGGGDQGVLLARAAVGVPRFRFVVPSRPGYLSTPLGEARTPESQADVCAALLDSLGMPEAAVIAISGAAIALRAAAEHHATPCATTAWHRSRHPPVPRYLRLSLRADIGPRTRCAWDRRSGGARRPGKVARGQGAQEHAARRKGVGTRSSSFIAIKYARVPPRRSMRVIRVDSIRSNRYIRAE